MIEFTKIINTYSKSSYLYDACKNKVVKLPEFIEDTDFKITEEYIAERRESYLELLAEGYFNGSKLEKIDNPMVEKSEKVLEKHLKGIILQITTNCNFACKYCFISEKYHHKKEIKTMNWSVAKKAIDYFMAHSKAENEININFYGGEPIINFSLIRQCVDYIEEYYSDRICRFNMTTNLSLLDDENLDFFVFHNFKLLVSLDGPMFVHNRNRVYKDGKNTYNVIETNLRYIKNKYPIFFKTITFNSVISDSNDYFVIKDFFLYKSLFRDSNNEINEFIISPLYLIDDVELLTEKVERKNNLRELIDYIKNQKHYMKELLVSFLISFDVIKFENKFENFYANGELVYWLRKFQDDMSEDSMELKKIGHPIGPCFAGSDKLMVDADGVYWPCEKVNTNNKNLSIGNIDAGIDVNQVNKMLNISKNYEKCSTCWCFRYCGQCIATITNATRETACSNSQSYIESKLVFYCNLIEINAECQKIIRNEMKNPKEIKPKDINEIIRHYINISIVEDSNVPVFAAYEMYKLIVILTYQYGIKIKIKDVIEYSDINDFIDRVLQI